MINTLPEFESRQVLTKEELNWVACYLDSQNRQTRQMLVGSGLIAGLQIRIVNNTIQVSNGCGLTSAGHIMSLQNPNNEAVTFTRQLVYSPKAKEKLAFHYLADTLSVDNDYSMSVNGSPLYFPGFTGEVLELFEDVVNNTNPINVQALKGRVLVLFQEIVQKELKDCEDDNCQDKGKKYIFTTKVLVITKEDALKLLNAEFGLQNATEDAISRLAFPQIFLPNINILKPVFSNFSINTAINETLICDEYKRCIKDLVDFLNTNKASINEALKNLKNFAGGKQSYIIVEKVLENINKTKVLANAEKLPKIYQITYDWLWTWVKAYQELQNEAQKMRSRSLGNSASHPNHILCGVLDFSNTEFDYAVASNYSLYRHGFQARFTQGEHARVQKNVDTMYSRLLAIINAFDDTIVTNIKELKLLNSGNIQGPLGDQAVPFYLKPEVLSVWSELSAKPNMGKYITNYGQHNESLIASANNTFNSQSTAFQSYNNFYRIEGAYMQPALSALNTIFQLRKKHALPFEVIMLRLNEKSPASNSFNFSINEDIESLYQVIRAELMKQIALNTNYLAGLQIRSNRFEAIKSLLIKNLEASYFSFLGNLNGILTIPLNLVLEEAVFASNITASNKMTSFAKTEPKYQELETTINAQKLTTTSSAKVEAVSYRNTQNLVSAQIFNPIFNFEVIGVLFFNTLGQMVNSIKANSKFKDTSELSFYTQLYGVAKKLQGTEKGQVLFLQALALYCALKLQEQHLDDNFLELNIANYKTNLESNLLPSCNSIIAQLKKLNTDFVRTDETLQEVIKGEMLDYADRIKFDDDWVKIIQIDAENKKRNGGLGVENLFDRFVKLHPGLSHGCGVPEGGTYVLVYDQANQITADFYLPYIISSHLRPIQFTLLEQKTFTLSGKITDDAGAVVIATLLVGAATVISDSNGFYNALVSENTTVKVIIKQAGFANFEQEIKIDSASKTLDIVLKRVATQKASTVTFVNQLGQAKNIDIRLLDAAGKETIAVGGKLVVTGTPQTAFKFTVADGKFSSLDFNIVIGAADKNEVITLVEVQTILIKIKESNGGFIASKFKSIKITNPDLAVDTSGLADGLFVTKEPFDIGKTATAVAIYGGITKQQVVKPGNAVDIVFDTVVIPQIKVFAAVHYPTLVTGALAPKLDGIELNGKVVKLEPNTNVGSADLITEGSVKLDPIFINAPEVIISKITDLEGAIFLVDDQLIINKTDISQTSSIFTFNKALTPVDLRSLMTLFPEIRSLNAIAKLNLLNSYTLIMNKDKIQQFRTLLGV